MVPSPKCEQLRLLVYKLISLIMFNFCFNNIDNWTVVFLWGRGSLWALRGCDTNYVNMYKTEKRMLKYK